MYANTVHLVLFIDIRYTLYGRLRMLHSCFNYEYCTIRCSLCNVEK